MTGKILIQECFSGGTVVKNLPANTGDAGDVGSIPGLGKSPGGGNSNPLQYSCLGNPMDRGAWSITFHGVSKSRTQLSMQTIKTYVKNLNDKGEISLTPAGSKPRWTTGVTVQGDHKRVRYNSATKQQQLRGDG